MKIIVLGFLLRIVVDFDCNSSYIPVSSPLMTLFIMTRHHRAVSVDELFQIINPQFPEVVELFIALQHAAVTLLYPHSSHECPLTKRSTRHLQSGSLLHDGSSSASARGCCSFCSSEAVQQCSEGWMWPLKNSG